MRRALNLATALSLLVSAPALAQIWIGQVVGNLMQPWPMPDSCYDGTARINEKAVAKVTPWVDKAVDHYREIALTPDGLKPAFTKHGRLIIDGAESDPATAKDPWIGPSTHVILDSFVRANGGTSVLARWRAIAGDGNILGTYEALMEPAPHGFRFAELKMHSGTSGDLQPLKPYCQIPGDAEKWRDAKAKRDAEKAARQADHN